MMDKSEREALYLSLPVEHRRLLLGCEEMQQAAKLMDEHADFLYLTEREKCGLLLFFPIARREAA